MPILMDLTARLELPDRYNLVDHFVDRHVREGRGDKTAIISGDLQVTYGEIAEQVNRVGNGLLALGLQEEQRVLLVLPDSPEFAASYFGTMKIGAVGSADEHGVTGERLRLLSRGEPSEGCDRPLSASR